MAQITLMELTGVFLCALLYANNNNYSSMIIAHCLTDMCVHDPVLFVTEQYESFVKFTQDQIMRRYGARPASCMYSHNNTLLLMLVNSYYLYN